VTPDLQAAPQQDRWQLTIRRSTPEERAEKWPPLIRGKRRIRIPKYVVVAARHVNEHMQLCSVFGLPLGGDTRSEAVFWAERTASKNGYDYIPPPGWENVEGRLP
jgi:hypothetical protein